MDSAEPDWGLYRTFLAVSRDGSLSAAARRIGLTQPTVGRQIEALEARLGTSLFTRSPRGLVPTMAARELLPQAEAMAVAADALRRASSAEAQDERGTVRVTATEMVGHEVLPAILAEFAWRHPRIDLELSLTSRYEDLLQRDADVAVRMVRPTQKALVARRIGAVNFGLFAHRRYAEAFGLPKSLDELVSRHRLIGFDRDMQGFRAIARGPMPLRREQFGFRCDGPTQLAAMRAGVGIGGCHVAVARRDPDLLPVLARSFHYVLDMWLAMHRDARGTRRVRLLFDHLARGLKAYVDEGERP